MVKPFSKSLPLQSSQGTPFCALPNLTADIGDYSFTAKLTLPPGTEEGVEILDTKLVEGSNLISEDTVMVDYTSDKL